MNYNRVGFVGTTLLFFLMISPAGAESVADKLKQTLDKLKQLQGQQQPNQASSPAGQAAAPNQNNAPKVGSSQSSATSSDGKTSSSVSSGGSKATGNGGAGPDVMGIRLRMTPSEAAAAIKARPNLLKGYREYSSILQYRLPNGTTADIPGGEFNKLFLAHEKKGAGYGDKINEGVLVFFAPVPGKDRVVGVSRYQEFPDGKQPEYGTLVKALVEKYGKPSSRGSGGLEQLIWLYDTNLKPKSKPIGSYTCAEVPEATSSTIRYDVRGGTGYHGPDWALEDYGQQGESITKCGEATLSVTIFRTQPASPLVSSINTRLSGVGDALIAQQEASRIVAMHQKNTIGKEAAKAKQRKLDL